MSKVTRLLWIPACLLFPITVAAQVADSVVTIYCTTQSGSSQGTGFVFGSHGLIVTAYHVIEDAKTIVVRDSSFHELPDLTVQQIDPQNDIAILESSESPGLPGLKPPSTPPTSQVEVRVAGSPRGLPKQILFGRLTSAGTVHSTSLPDASGQAIFAREIDIYPVDVTIYSGMSGAPVIAANDAVLGVFSGSYSEGRGIGWAIPTKYILALLSQPALGKSVDAMSAWPRLDLMGNRWVSLKRSYDKPFDSEHIANLEVLEQALTTLRGRWVAEENTRTLEIVLYGGCNKVTSDQRVFSFDHIDQNKAAIVGHWERNYVVDGEWTPPLYPETSVPIETQRSFCNIMANGDQFKARAEMHLQGSILMSIESVDDFAENSKFTVEDDVQDCQGNICEAKLYGKHDGDGLEIISSQRLRSGAFILAKVN
jgi:hypothetical protein